MRFHLIAGTLLALSGLLLYWLIFGFERDLHEARETIRQESVASTQNIEKLRKAPELHTFINKALVDRSNQDFPNSIRKTEPEIIQPSVVEENQTFESQLDGGTYWCRNVPLLMETEPVKCVYPDACYGCEGAIIPPEVENAIPLCVNGTKSQLYHVECCPNFNNDAIECPGAEACFKAENIPQDQCSCGDSPNCKLKQVGEKIDCVCTP